MIETAERMINAGLGLTSAVEGWQTVQYSCVNIPFSAINAH